MCLFLGVSFPLVPSRLGFFDMTPKLLIFIAFAFLALHATPVIGARREFEFVLRWKWLNPDGYWRNVMTINDQFPGPVINITQGDMVSLKVKSELIRDVTSMHFHGLTMKGYPFMDGAAYVTQVRRQPLRPRSVAFFFFSLRKLHFLSLSDYIP
jgi:FtsP/CotA-like multicopper oxidase with cupredoxin domain